MRFWLGFVAVFLAAEAYALASPTFPTLSQVWRQLVTGLPTPWGIILAAVTGAVLLWLLGPHWAWSSVDRPGLDRLEVLAIAVGALWAGAGAVAMRRKHRTQIDKEGPQ